LLGARASLHVTRFDQRATGLVQPVTLMVTPTAGAPSSPGGPVVRNLAYQLQNVGAIDNRGWEMEASWRQGPISVHGSVATVDSRVRTVRRGYTGELRPGDRVLDVPGRTLGLAARVSRNGWQSALQLTRVDDWIGYDRIAATQAFVMASRPSTDFVGPSLRQFWTRYDAVTRLNVSFARALPGGLALQLAGDNLLNVQTGEPDNITIVPGRTLSLSLRARF
jgi:iron complex outermembrane receptor protein